MGTHHGSCLRLHRLEEVSQLLLFCHSIRHGAVTVVHGLKGMERGDDREWNEMAGMDRGPSGCISEGPSLRGSVSE